jgi:DNA-binding PadR family transcriptional regulator
MADTLGLFEQAVLLAIVRLGDGAYGRAILAEVQARLNRDVSAGAIYATLDRLEAKGLTSSRLGTGTPQRGGRARRFYSVKAEGVGALTESKSVTASIWRGITLPLKGRA